MLGGQYVAISGPCVEQGATIRVLSFGSPKKCERKSDFSFVCITPIFSNTGDVLFLINIENKAVNSTHFKDSILFVSIRLLRLLHGFDPYI